MKKLFSPLLIILYLTFQFSYLQAQNNIGIGTTTPNAKALLDLTANDKGLLVPRVTTTQRIAINPVGNADASLLVYDTNDSLFYFWNSAQWVPFPQQGGSNNISLNFDANTGVLSLTDNGGTLTTNIPPDNDSDPNNELITNVVFNANGNILTINEGGNTWSTAISIVDPDSDPANEYNTALSFNSNTNILSVTDAGGSINTDLSSLSNNWKLLGNAGTNPATNFLGTTDNQDLVFRTNNTEKVRVLSNGNVGIGTSSPVFRLDVEGDVEFGTGTSNLEFIQNGTTFEIRHHDPGVAWNNLSLNPYGGNVGIGTAAPQEKLHINGLANTTFIKMTDGTRFLDIRLGNSFQSHTNNDGVVYFEVGGTETYMFGGNVFPDADGGRDLGSSAYRWRDVYAANGTINTSDLRLKKEIKTTAYGLKQVMQMNPVSFLWKDSGEGKKLGFIAQELQQLVPEVVSVGNDENKTLGVFYSDLIPVLTKAIQEQQQQIENLKSDKAGMVAEIKKLNTEIEWIKDSLLKAER